MTDTNDQKGKRERSPSFPFVPLKVATERLFQFENYFGRHPAPADKAGLAWKMKGDSSQAQQTLAAIKAFGLIEYQGSGKDRKAVISDSGRTYLRAQQEEIKQKILKKAALKPKIIGQFWSKWGADRPPDPVCLDELVLKHPFNENAAPVFLKVYDDTIAYAQLLSSDKTNKFGEETENHRLDEADESPVVKVGDLVQWESQGTQQFPAPRRVTGTHKHDDGDWFVSVEGYPGALPMEQIEVVVSPAVVVTQPLNGNGEGQTPSADPIDVFFSGGRLQISANVGLKGLGKLKIMLEKYEEILKLEDNSEGAQ